jgi:mycothiol synthase
MEDAEAVAGLVNVCSMELIGRPGTETGEVRADWGEPGLKLESDTLLVRSPQGEFVGYAAIWDGAPHLRKYAHARVHPEWRGQGIGGAICQWVEERGRQSIARAPAGARVALMQATLSTDAAAQELLSRQGYQLVRRFFHLVIEMTEPPPAPAVPEGIVIRPFARDREARAFVAAVHEEFMDHWGYVERPLEEMYQEYMHTLDNHPNSDPSLWFVAVDSDEKEIAGTSLCWTRMPEDPDMGWIDDLGVRRPWRGRGIATALLLHSFGELYLRGKRRVGLGADTESLTGATRLYEKVGMQVLRRFQTWEKELRPGEELSTRSLEA